MPLLSSLLCLLHLAKASYFIQIKVNLLKNFQQSNIKVYFLKKSYLNETPCIYDKITLWSCFLRRIRFLPIFYISNSIFTQCWTLYKKLSSITPSTFVLTNDARRMNEFHLWLNEKITTMVSWINVFSIDVFYLLYKSSHRVP